MWIPFDRSLRSASELFRIAVASGDKFFLEKRRRSLKQLNFSLFFVFSLSILNFLNNTCGGVVEIRLNSKGMCCLLPAIYVICEI